MGTLEIILCVIVGVILIVGGICFIINQKKSIKEWLVLAVTEAEKALGSKTGRLKLRLVFENFVKLFPFFSKFVSFVKFSKWVDIALDQMKVMLTSNKEVQEYVTPETEKGDSNGVAISE